RDHPGRRDPLASSRGSDVSPLVRGDGKGLSLMQRDLKVVFSGFPLTCCCRGYARNRMCKATDRQKRYRSGADQLVNQRVKLSRLRMLAEHDEALNH
ncbi:MAG: hypothetical protein WB999_05390, partial [Candidatus Binataceae bacterium]